jgi:putative ABC transport system permease protein
MVKRFKNLWRNVVHKADVERDLDEEIQTYHDMLAESKRNEGLGSSDARRAATIEIQGPEQLKESVRQARAGYQLEICLRDMRHGLRMLAKSPGFTAVAILTLALGVGANSAIFSVVNGVLLRALPFDEPDRLVRVCATADFGGYFLIQVTSWKDLADWKQQNDVLEQLAVFTPDNDSYTGSGAVEQIDTADVSDGFFELLRVKPILGRTFVAGDRPGHRMGPGYPITGADGVNVLGEGFWRERFGADPNIVGRSVIVDGYPSTVVGVVPDRFDSLVGHAGIYFPYAPNELDGRGDRHLPVIGRLKPGVSAKQAAAEMEAIAARLRDLYPDDNYKIGATVIPLQDMIVGNIRWMLLVLLGAVSMVLLIACANVGNLLLARASARWQEVAIRSALGGSRARLLRQFLTESLVLSGLGGAFALFLAYAVIKLLVKLAPGNIPRLQEVGLDGNVLAFTIVLTLSTAVIFGLAPAMRLSGNAFAEALKEAGRGPRGARRHTSTRKMLVAGEIAVSLVLLTGSGLLIRSFYKLRSTSPGFETRGLVMADVVLPEPKDRAPDSRRLFYDLVYRQLSAVPGVASIALTNTLPVSGGGDSSWFGFVPEGRPFTREESVGLQQRRASPGYFRTMQIPLIGGREFNDFDASNAQRVVVLTKTAAHRLWPGEDPVGKTLLSSDSDQPVPMLVVGVVGDVKRDALEDRDDMAAYVPCAQAPLPFLIVVARVGTEQSNVMASITNVAASIRDVIQSADRDLPVYNIRTMDQVVDNSLALRKFNLMLVSAFAGLALLLAAVGAYGVISYSVAERVQEIGVRMALGATRMNIVSLVVGQGFRLALVGAGIGLVGSFALTRLIETFLFEVSPTDPLTFALVAGFLFAVSLLAAYIPARRATTVDPMRALRSE